jgi:hypothetical protein
MPSPQSGTVCTADTPESPLDAVDADVADPGIATESKESGAAEELTTDEKTTSSEDEDEETHWVGIELKDDDGNPVPKEVYKVKFSDGKVITGRLDEEGKAKVERLLAGGECEVTFPRIHEEEVAKQ